MNLTGNMKFKKKFNHITPKFGSERRLELLSDIANKQTFVPKGVNIYDMDKEFNEFIKNDLSIIFNDSKLESMFLSRQKWVEFQNKFQNSNEYGNINFPLLTIFRNPNVQKGTIRNSDWNIPVNRDYIYTKIPQFDGNRQGYDVYKIPQPTNVDITYNLRFFSNKLTECNLFQEKILKIFNSRQKYLKVNEHFMPLVLEDISDESQLTDINERTYYVQVFEIKLLGFILDENDFEIYSTIDREFISTEIITKQRSVNYKLNVNTNLDLTIFNFILNQNSQNFIEFNSDYDMSFKSFELVSNVVSLEFYVNGVKTNIPFNVKVNDTIRIYVTKNNSNESRFVVNGQIIK